MNGIIDSLTSYAVLNFNAEAGVVLQIVKDLTPVADYLFCIFGWGTLLTFTNSTGDACVVALVERVLAHCASQNVIGVGTHHTVCNY